jgi:16S rRNA (guanine527-N7)-methyltransferase
VEATRKKCDFLQAVVGDLHLSTVKVLNARAEEAGRLEEHREQYDIAIARAVADLPVLIEYLLPFVKIGGFAVAQKSREAADELDRADTAILLLGGLGSKIIDVKVPGLNDERALILVEKITATSGEYPRRTGVPAKKPLL